MSSTDSLTQSASANTLCGQGGCLSGWGKVDQVATGQQTTLAP